MFNRGIWVVLFVTLCYSMMLKAQRATISEFNKIAEQKGELLFSDSFKSDWKNKWMLDGEEAVVESGNGMLKFFSGSKFLDNAHHSVIWTKKVFEGDIRIEFDFIRNDTIPRFVNIIYLFASGSGKDEFKEDISTWSQLRKIPAMQLYFNHMNLYHISFAAFDVDNKDASNDYIRLRRYLPETGNGINGTEIFPDFERTSLFKPFEKHHISIVRKGSLIWMKISTNKTVKVYKWDTSGQPPVLKGRIGIRIMASRASIFSDFKIYEVK